MERDHFLHTVEAIGMMDISAHILSHASHPPVNVAKVRTTGKKKSSNIGIVELSGTLMKHTSSMSDGTSTVQARRAIRQLSQDPEVDGILLHIDSHGGTVAGTGELGDDVRRAAQSKPVHSFIDDHGFSAAYWVPSQSQHVTINSYGHAGSIGTYGVVVDSSQRFEKEGVKVHVVSTGDYKGAGVPGSPVTDQQLSHYQEVVESMNSTFLDAVSTGRSIPLDDLKAIADGRVFNATESKRLKLVDAVGTVEEAMEHLENKSVGKVSASVPRVPVAEQQEETMSENTVASVAATVDQIKAVAKNANAEFILAQLTAGATVDQVKDAWIEELSKTQSVRQTVATTQLSESDSQTAVDADDLDGQVRDLMERGYDRRTAVRQVFKSNPEAHRSYLKSHPKNQSPFVQMHIDAKYKEYANK